MTSIGICLPVGPRAHHKQYLDEALDSIAHQTQKPNSVQFVDDMANLDEAFIRRHFNNEIPFEIWKAPWRMGVAHAFNCGVALSGIRNDAVVMMGADDTLEPDCIEECAKAYERNPFKTESYFWMGLRYMDTGEQQFLPCNAAMVTLPQWVRSGGFQPESAVGAPDTMLISVMLTYREAGRLVCINEQKPLYNYRRHELTDTAEHREYYTSISQVRDIITRTWQPPQWERYQ